jgi:uncharacterized protein
MDFDIGTEHICIGTTIVIIIFVLLYLFVFKEKPVYSHNDKLIVKESLIPNSGRGVFANKDFKKGDVVEVCPLISDKKENIKNSVISNYTFKNKFKDEEVIVFGLCSMYNHSDNHNIYHDQDGQGNMVYTAFKDIKNGDELYVNYGSNYWNSRNK